MENERKRLSGMEFPGLEGKTYYTTGFPTEEGGEIFNDYENNQATGLYSHAEGIDGVIASGTGAHAEGRETQALARASHAEGYLTVAGIDNENGEGAHAEGLNTKATAQGSHAEGKSTIAASPYQHVEGRYNVEDANGTYAHILGGGAEYSTGRACTVYDIRGKNCNIFYSYAGKTAGGANGVNLIVYGAQGTLNNFQQLAESGFIHQQTDTVEMKVDISNMDFLKLEIIVENDNASCGSAWANALIGKCHDASYGCSRATSLSNDIPYKVYDVIYLSDLPFTISDYPGNAQYPVRHACADCQWYTIDNPVKIALKDSKGNSQTFDKGLGVHPYALNTKPTTKTVLQNAYEVDWAGNAAFAGNITSAGKRVLTQQENGGTTSNSQLNVAGDDAHAEGFLTQALGFGSHAEGYGSDNDGSYWTIASGTGSHAEGVATEASGKGSHSEGETTNAVGNFSHAEGWMTAALGSSSHAEGFATQAYGEAQHVQGSLNIPDVFDSQGRMYDANGNITEDINQAISQNNYAHIVGNGGISKSYSNAHTLDWNGNAWFAGEVKVGGTGQFDPQAKTLLTAEDLPISNKKWITLLDNFVFDNADGIVPFVLQPNQKYRVTFDGIDFYCSTQLYVDPNDKTNTALLLGNVVFVDLTESGTGEPFAIISLQGFSVMFIEGSQCTISIAILQDMINPSHIVDMYHTEIGEVHLATYILKDSISFLPDMNISSGTLTTPLNLQSGEEYVVNWLGRYYWCVAKNPEDDNTEIWLGNAGVVGGIDSGEPFFFAEDQSTETVVWRGENKAEVMPIQIFKTGTIHPVPEKYLPESVATKDYVNSMVGNGGGTAIKLHIWEEND